jgi:TonB-dependent SusC/RagA subfamily outer membrane receptor
MRSLLISCFTCLLITGQLFAQSKNDVKSVSKSILTVDNISVHSLKTTTITDTTDMHAFRRSLLQNVGYGLQKRDEVTGAVSSINMKTVEHETYSNLAEFLMGRVAGVTVTQDAGSPGGYDISIRGINSLNFQAPPLFVIDGVPVSAGNALNMLNPQDIASIDIIKDGTAAIYGTRGANGVILITTKH